MPKFNLPNSQGQNQRLRGNASIRKLISESILTPESFVYPLFLTHGTNVREPIPPMPGCYRWSLDTVLEEVAVATSLGVPGLLLFGIPEEKDSQGSGAYSPNGIIQQGISRIKHSFPEMLVITDVCLCEYTDHGHCGVTSTDGSIDTDYTLGLLADIAQSHAQAGADIVAPSAMIDRQVAVIREALDSSGKAATPIMGYSAKFASSFYGPFRVAAESAPKFGDRKNQQIDPANRREALREIDTDISEGADIVMIKPALPYLDVIAYARGRVDVPIAAFNVSGEYSMLKAAAENGWLDGSAAMLETLTSISRAGADIIITYHALEASRLMHDMTA